MAEHRHLPKAPLKEALIDIRFEPRRDLASLSRLYDSISRDYPSVTDLWEALVDISEGEDGPSAKTDQAVVGKRFDAPDKPFVLQVRSGSLTVSRLTPYGQWSDLLQEAQRWWAILETTVAPTRVTRLAVRYINDVVLPLPITNFAEYLTCPPDVPENLPQGMTSFLQRVVIPDQVSQCVAIVTQAMEPPRLRDNVLSVSVIIDIDVFREVAIGPQDFPEIWLAFEALREQKNKLFFGYITEKTAGFFI